MSLQWRTIERARLLSTQRLAWYRLRVKIKRTRSSRSLRHRQEVSPTREAVITPTLALPCSRATRLRVTIGTAPASRVVVVHVGI
jgi:hypothetical protein